MFYLFPHTELHKASGLADFDEAHEFRADKPEECLFILGRGFLNYGLLTRLKSFAGLRDWYFNLQRPEIARAYEFYKQELQLIGNKSVYLIICNSSMRSLDMADIVAPGIQFLVPAT